MCVKKKKKHYARLPFSDNPACADHYRTDEKYYFKRAYDEKKIKRNSYTGTRILYNIHPDRLYIQSVRYPMDLTIVCLNHTLIVLRP